MSVLCQNLLHTSLVCVRYKAKPPEKSCKKKKKKEASLRMNNISRITTRHPPNHASIHACIQPSRHREVQRTRPPAYLDRLVTGSRITMHSFTSPNLQKYSFKPSEKTGWGRHVVRRTPDIRPYIRPPPPTPLPTRPSRPR